jgi:hypothetical protein
VSEEFCVVRSLNHSVVAHASVPLSLFNKVGRVPHYQNSTVHCFGGARRVSAKASANVDRVGSCPYCQREQSFGLTGDFFKNTSLCQSTFPTKGKVARSRTENVSEEFYVVRSLNHSVVAQPCNRHFARSREIFCVSKHTSPQHGAPPKGELRETQCSSERFFHVSPNRTSFRHFVEPKALSALP